MSEAGGETKTIAQAYENDVALPIAEQEALEEWSLHMHRCGYPTQFDILQSIVEYVLSLEIGNGGTLNVLAISSSEPSTAVECRDGSGNLIGSFLVLVGKAWYKRFLSLHPALSAIYSRCLDNRCALNNDPRIIREYFGIPKEVIAEFKNQDQGHGQERVSSWVGTAFSEDGRQLIG
jgi:hypothetical protein